MEFLKVSILVSRDTNLWKELRVWLFSKKEIIVSPCHTEKKKRISHNAIPVLSPNPISRARCCVTAAI